MNTQELAAKIAAKRKEQEEAESNANSPETAVPAGMTNSKPPTTKKEEIRVGCLQCSSLFISLANLSCMLIEAVQVCVYF